MPHRCAFRHASRTLLVADLHLGKCETLRAHGLTMPAKVSAGILDEQLARLEHAIRLTAAREVVVVGDLLHAPAGLEADLIDRVSRWRLAIDLPFRLVLGNHDRRAERIGDCWNLQITREPIRDDPFLFVHDPADLDAPPPRPLFKRAATPSAKPPISSPGPPGDLAPASQPLASPPPTRPYAWCGHIHPAIRLSSGVDSVKLPCFIITPDFAILPAFSGFTGGASLRPGPADRVFAIADGDVFPV